MLISGPIWWRSSCSDSRGGSRHIHWASTLSDRVGGTNNSPRLRRSNRRTPAGSRPYFSPVERCPRLDLQEHREELGGSVFSDRHLRLELHILDCSSRRPRHSRSGRVQARPQGGEAQGHAPRAERVRQHVQRLRPLHPRRNEEEVGGRREGHHWWRIGLGSTLWVRAGSDRWDRCPAQYPCMHGLMKWATSDTNLWVCNCGVLKRKQQATNCPLVCFL